MYPVLFQIGGFEFYSNAVILFFGIIFSSIFLMKNVKKYGLSINFLNDYFYILVISFFLFGRLGEVFLNFSMYLKEPLKILYFWDGNFSFFIGIIGVGLVFYILTFLKKENFLKWIDASFLPFLMGIMFISIADFMAGANYGLPTNGIFGIVFGSPDVKYTLPIHPVQLYEFFAVLMIFFIVKFFSKKKRFAGVLSSFGFFLFFVTEFVLEFFRANIDLMIFGFKFHQILFGVLAFFSLVFFIFKSHRNVDIYAYKK
ncbi:prolipoprotein diacylglyceryl transferase [Candidatus Gracilibacteria bacterium]|nr:prolipoprotein diacylglyceryl transferase [Candidatus Gracilibacteria bacterium]